MHEETSPGMRLQNYGVFYRRFNALKLAFSRNKKVLKNHIFSYQQAIKPLNFSINKQKKVPPTMLLVDGVVIKILYVRIDYVVKSVAMTIVSAACSFFSSTIFA